MTLNGVMASTKWLYDRNDQVYTNLAGQYRLHLCRFSRGL